MISPILKQGTTIDEIASLDGAIKNSNYTKEAISDKKMRTIACKSFLVGGAAMACLLVAPTVKANIHPKHEIISCESLSDIVRKTEQDLWETTNDVQLITTNSLNIDSLIDGDEIREEMEIISDYMKKAKNIYASCNDGFTL